MGLFDGGHHEEEKPTPSMRPFVVRTQNVAKELLQTASTYRISVHDLDFELLDVQTYVKRNADNPQEEWVELTEGEIGELDAHLFLDMKFDIKQMYEIEIFHSAEREALPVEHLDVSIGGNHTLCKIYLTIKTGNVLNDYPGFEEDFLLLVKKKKMRAGILIGVFDSMMPANFKDLFAKVRVHKNYTLHEPEQFLIAQAYEPVETINDKLILHFEAKRKNQDEHGRIDYAKRGYIISAVENELLIEYVKPKKGENGRNCRGERLIPKEPVVRYEPTFGVGELINVIDKPERIEYRAKTGGYVTFEGGIYNIRTEVDISEISFKTTGSIDTQLDADVSINVKEKDVLKDAIGMGMDVTVNVINIDGSIGPNAKVTARRATVEGQVHQSAIITADELSINILKGTAHGKEVHITRLEHGIVDAEKVTVSQATGGKIRAKEVVIDVLGSHVKITASHKIEIMKMIGGENQFIIDPLLNETVDELSAQEKKMAEARVSIQAIHKELSGYEQTERDNATAMEDMKKKLLNYKKNGVKLPSAFVQKYQQYQNFKEKLIALRQELAQKEDQLAYLSEKHTAIQNEIMDARIIIHERWKNHNEIVFKLIDPPIEVFYHPPHNSDGKILGLSRNDDGEYSIKVLPA